MHVKTTIPCTVNSMRSCVNAGVHCSWIQREKNDGDTPDDSDNDMEPEVKKRKLKDIPVKVAWYMPIIPH